MVCMGMYVFDFGIINLTGYTCDVNNLFNHLAVIHVIFHWSHLVSMGIITHVAGSLSQLQKTHSVVFIPSVILLYVNETEVVII